MVSRHPHDPVETNFQRHFSISVCCGMLNDMLIGPVILDDRMTGNNYLNFLQNGLPEQLEDVPFGYTDCYVLSARWSPFS
jgi:hypothetical protein